MDNLTHSIVWCLPEASAPVCVMPVPGSDRSHVVGIYVTSGGL